MTNDQCCFCVAALDFALLKPTTRNTVLIRLSLSSPRHTSPFWFLFFFFFFFVLLVLHRAAFNFLHSRVCHLRLIRLRLVLSSSPCGVLPSMRVSPLAPAPIFAQIHRAASAPRPSASSRACRSTSTSRSAPNPPASPCRPSKTGERPELCSAAVVGFVLGFFLS